MAKTKKKTFTVTLEFADNITKKQEIGIAINIARAIRNEAMNSEVGIAPDHTYTERVVVTPEGSNKPYLILLGN